jgi:hypothetical protein
MLENTKARWLFKIWLRLYQLENYLWHHYADSFRKLNGGKDFPEYHQDQPNSDEDLPF